MTDDIQIPINDERFFNCYRRLEILRLVSNKGMKTIFSRLMTDILEQQFITQKKFHYVQNFFEKYGKKMIKEQMTAKQKLQLRSYYFEEDIE